MKLVSRTLHVKRVTYRGRGNREASDLPTLDEMIKGIFAKGDTVGKRHYPAADNLKPGKPCVCFDDYVDSGVGARFKMYSYVHAHTPDQVVPDLNAKHVNLVTEPLETADGKQKAVAIMCQVIVLGETMIVEYASGSGGVAAVVSALAYLSKKVDRRIAHMKAQNIPSRALTQMIKENGGVREVRATLRGTVPIESRFGMTLSTVRKGMGNATRVTTTWEADDDKLLSEADVTALWGELDPTDGLTSVSLRFGNGTTQNEIETYQEKKVVTVQAVRAGIPAATEIAEALEEYMEELMSPTDGTRIISEKGFVIPIPI